MAFRGWPTEALDFYEGLEADNSKTYWTAHKAVYEEKVPAPMRELLAALEPEFGESKIFRPYRDVRFSADKSPYKTAIGATLERGGYVQLSAQGLAAAPACTDGAGGTGALPPAVADTQRGGAAPVFDALSRRSRTDTHVRTVPRGFPGGSRADLPSQGRVRGRNAGGPCRRASAKTASRFLRAPASGLARKLTP